MKKEVALSWRPWSCLWRIYERENYCCHQSKYTNTVLEYVVIPLLTGLICSDKFVHYF